MCRLTKTILYCIFFILYSLFFIPQIPAIAQQEFDTRFNSTYQISDQGITTVTHEIQLTNLLSKVYAQQYTINEGSTRIKQIQAQSNSGPVTVKSKTLDNQTEINLFFDEPVVGKNQTQRFTISYINLDIATKNGRVLEVNIPRLSNLNNLDSYNLTLQVPQNFDQPRYIFPPTSNISSTPEYQIIRFAKNQITSKGISLLFGDHQNFDFTLRYSLYNPGVTAAATQIAMPPDTAFQQLFYQSIDPQPLNIEVDPDQNWLAIYKLKPKQTLIITLTGQVTLFLEPTLPIPPAPDLDSLLDPHDFWQTQEPKIIQLAQQLKTPENIYNFLVQNFTYNYDRIDSLSTSRLGALNAINNPTNAICTEFTDAFIALARAANIPARAHDGYGYTPNSRLRPLSLKLDVLHAWPEYYNQDTNQWVQIDPTWGNTTQGIDYFSRWDLNHFTFTIHGQDSINPYPAGSYKLETTAGKDINVSFAQNEPIPQTQLEVDFKPISANLPLLNQSYEIIISNLGNTALHQPDLKLKTRGYNIIEHPDKITTLPPFAQITLKAKLKPNIFFKTNKQLSLTIESQEFIYDPQTDKTSAAPKNKNLQTLILGSTIFTAAYIIWRLLVPKFQKKYPLHR